MHNKLYPAFILTIGCLALQVYSAFNVRNLSQYVDPRVGTEGTTNCVIGPQVPWGSINPSPDTKGSGGCDGYTSASDILGFSQTHASGTGATDYGNFLVSPQIGLVTDPASHASAKSNEAVACGYYKVILTNYNILCEVTPTHHAAIYKFTFPASDNAYILIDGTYNLPGNGAKTGAVTIDAAQQKMTGWANFNGGWVGGGLVYYCAKVSKTPVGYGTWKNGTSTASSTSATIGSSSDKAGGYFKFSTTANEAVYLKIAISMVSIANAESYLNAEIPAWDFDRTRLACTAKWDTLLSTILIDDPTITTDQLKLFYTNLYRCAMMPRDRTGDCPFKGADNLTNWNGPYWDDQYCGWDTFRSLFPLMTILKESFIRGNIASFIARFKRNGGTHYVNDSWVMGAESHIQGGDDVDPVIAEAYAKGVSGVDWSQAYNLLKYHADNARHTAYRQNDRGWIPNDVDKNLPVSKTLEMAYNDFNAALVAKGLNKTTDYDRYLARSGKWEALWKSDCIDGGYSGFMQTKNQDGSWVAADVNARTAWDKPVYEGSLWGYSYDVPHNIARIVQLMGGPTTFADRTKYYMDNRKHEWENEPCFLNSRLFNYAGRPDLTAYYAREGMKIWTLTPQGFISNDDSGAMASFYVLSALGFYPVAGQDVYLITAPVYEQFTLQMENGKNVVIHGPKANEPTKKYVQSATLNNVTYSKNWFRHGDIKNGANLSFIMGTAASAWGKTDLPPSGTTILSAPTGIRKIEPGPRSIKTPTIKSIPGKGLSISLPANSHTVVALTNCKGSIVFKNIFSGQKNEYVPMDRLSSGVYVVSMFNGSQVLGTTSICLK